MKEFVFIGSLIFILVEGVHSIKKIIQDFQGKRMIILMNSFLFKPIFCIIG
ncbi:MAG: hypothetical protein RI983_90 [Bacteroidota bacterium]|jgi:hypothetical protein